MFPMPVLDRYKEYGGNHLAKEKLLNSPIQYTDIQTFKRWLHARSSIFCEIETRSEKGITTIKRPRSSNKYKPKK